MIEQLFRWLIFSLKRWKIIILAFVRNLTCTVLWKNEKHCTLTSPCLSLWVLINFLSECDMRVFYEDPVYWPMLITLIFSAKPLIAVSDLHIDCNIAYCICILIIFNNLRILMLINMIDVDQHTRICRVIWIYYPYNLTNFVSFMYLFSQINNYQSIGSFVYFNLIGILLVQLMFYWLLLVIKSWRFFNYCLKTLF